VSTIYYHALVAATDHTYDETELNDLHLARGFKLMSRCRQHCRRCASPSRVHHRLGIRPSLLAPPNRSRSLSLEPGHGGQRRLAAAPCVSCRRGVSLRSREADTRCSSRDSLFIIPSPGRRKGMAAPSSWHIKIAFAQLGHVLRRWRSTLVSLVLPQPRKRNVSATRPHEHRCNTMFVPLARRRRIGRATGPLVHPLHLACLPVIRACEKD
jgi:hypothetical protein